LTFDSNHVQIAIHILPCPSALAGNRLAVLGGLLVLGVFAVAVFAPFIAPHGPSEINIRNILTGPSVSHPFGTDELGRDVLARMIYGARVSLEVGFVAVGISTLIGVLLGAAAGYYGGYVDSAIMRAVDIMLSIPTIFLVLAVIAILEPNILNIMIVIGLTSWMEPARLIRAEFISLKEREFVVAARAIGASDGRIIFRHLLRTGSRPSSSPRPWAWAAPSWWSRRSASWASAFSRRRPPGAASFHPARTISRLPGGSRRSGARHPRHRAGIQSPGRGHQGRARSEAAGVILIFVDYTLFYYSSVIQMPVPSFVAGKFVQIKNGNTLYLVFSPKEFTKYHANIVERFCMDKGIEGSYDAKGERFFIRDVSWQVLGGGKFEWDKNKMIIKLYDNSMAYGKFRNEGLKEMLSAFQEFAGYDIIIE